MCLMIWDWCISYYLLFLYQSCNLFLDVLNLCHVHIASVQHPHFKIKICLMFSMCQHLLLIQHRHMWLGSIDSYKHLRPYHIRLIFQIWCIYYNSKYIQILFISLPAISYQCKPNLLLFICFRIIITDQFHVFIMVKQFQGHDKKLRNYHL